jgi:hypothetical protein
MLRRIRLALVLLGSVFVLRAHAEMIGNVDITAMEKRACMADVIRLCRSLMPDARAVFGCMQEKRTQLSSACDKVARARGL